MNPVGEFAHTSLGQVQGFLPELSEKTISVCCVLGSRSLRNIRPPIVLRLVNGQDSNDGVCLVADGHTDRRSPRSGVPSGTTCPLKLFEKRSSRTRLPQTVYEVTNVCREVFRSNKSDQSKTLSWPRMYSTRILLAELVIENTTHSHPQHEVCGSAECDDNHARGRLVSGYTE